MRHWRSSERGLSGKSHTHDSHMAMAKRGLWVSWGDRAGLPLRSVPWLLPLRSPWLCWLAQTRGVTIGWQPHDQVHQGSLSDLPQTPELKDRSPICQLQPWLTPIWPTSWGFPHKFSPGFLVLGAVPSLKCASSHSQQNWLPGVYGVSVKLSCFIDFHIC